jgi:hypothetical protein
MEKLGVGPVPDEKGDPLQLRGERRFVEGRRR